MSTDRAALLRLRADVERDLVAARALRADLSTRRNAILRGDDPVLLGYAAITLHQLYTALETAFERVARTLEGSLPVGRDSHRALLDDMGHPLTGLRPAVLRPETVNGLGTLLRFRHFVRHAYAVAWDPLKIGDVIASLDGVWPEIERDVLGFLAFVDGVIQAVGEPPS